MQENICLTTKIDITNIKGSVKFKCPNCGDYTIVRSARARKAAMKYTCPKCGFEGPN